VLGIALAAVVLCGIACSDAHTQAELNLADNGSDPTEITVLSPNASDVWLHALTAAYMVEHPEISFVYESQVTISPSAGKPKTLPTIVPEKRIAQGATPDLWIDDYLILKKHAKDPRAQAPPFRIGDDQLELVVQLGNPQNVTGYEVFGPGEYPRSGLCLLGTPCGLLARRQLIVSKVTAKPDLNFISGPALATGVVQGKVAAGLILGSDAAAQRANLTTITTARPIPYGAMAMATDPAAAKFLTWLRTSPEARTLITASGLTPPPGTT
jgi:hypothetical protein